MSDIHVSDPTPIDYVTFDKPLRASRVSGGYEAYLVLAIGFRRGYAQPEYWVVAKADGSVERIWAKDAYPLKLEVEA